MTWPGQDLWRPYVGLVAWLPRDHYDPGDPHDGRPTVVIKVLPAERACIVVTRTSGVYTVCRGDVVHQPDAALGCERQGWWQAGRACRVLFSAYEDEDTRKYAKLDDKTFDRIKRAYEEQQ
jgi:hypothetical protein